VTFCLQDAVSAKALRRQHLNESDEPHVIAGRSEPPSAAGTCLLQRPAAAAIVEDGLLHFQGERFALHAWVVMPNHVHGVITPFEEFPLSEILHSWKSFTSNRINRELGRTGTLWQADSFDHLIRNEESFSKFVAYTEGNPVAATLCGKPEAWAFSSARLR